MTTPFYVSPEQIMKDRAEYARKGISRGRSVAVIFYDKGILFVGENPSRALHKISEIYDRIAFAAAGRYNEYEQLRIAGVRHADMRGYVYDRRDVTGRALANTYAQALGTMFSEGAGKPYEVELAVAEVGEKAAEDQGYRVTFDGQVTDIRGFQVLGGAADAVTQVLESSFEENAALETVLNAAVDALGRDGTEPRTLTPNQLEVAVLDRTRTRVRKFRRITGPALASLLGVEGDGDGDGKGADGAKGGKDGKGDGAAKKDAPAAEAELGDGDVLGAVDDLLDEGDSSES
ncbi:proteasome subunit alpha [Catenulispora pinisilvae]|uniref:proteasome subunit alpha n=1 Tax=Catenulispora pinisilvae TaxID=2705253 RepID=UPI001890F841|nr:proteasome subunit alpha [Catenulispora pinisilvae]